MAANNLPHARLFSRTRRHLLMLGVIFFTACTLRASVREFDSGDYYTTYTLSLSRTTKPKEEIAGFNNTSLLYPKEPGPTKPKEVIAGFSNTTEPVPIISFIIPSTLRRATLNRTIKSLQKQSRSNWEAIVGVDLTISNLTEMQVASASLVFKQDRRVRYVPITSGRNRGRAGNGAGKIRNQMIRNHATAKWVAFVDDDDSLSPDYIKHWETGLQHDESADVIIFRMESRRNLFPPLEHGSVASENHVGISYAVRKELFVRKQNGIAFIPCPTEDYNLLKQGQACNATILISDCVAYFVRRQPNTSRNQTSCRFENATIADTPPSKKQKRKNRRKAKNAASHSHATVTAKLSHTNKTLS
jgi:cellulose synthase/poly-beta-1,6-N-acetylglucosamine synthase-like glycosyltransferase